MAAPSGGTAVGGGRRFEEVPHIQKEKWLVG
jgi:hypothetical protein